MRAGLSATLLLLAGCRQILGIESATEASDAAPVGDADVDADASGVVDASICYGAPGWQLCFDTLPPGAPVSLPATLNTDSSTLCQPAAWVQGSAQPPACMVVGTSISVPAATRVSGSKPLVLLATDTIDVAAVLTVETARNPSACNDVTLPADSTNGVGGGGAGGSHQSRGGLAGNGATSCAAISTYAALRGGLRGQTGGSGFGGTGLHAAGGNGGGAIYLVAGTSINISGAIDASGRGGAGAMYYGGGGGGGAGGMIALYAPTITSIGVVMANGGGGGIQGTNNASTADGDTPTTAAPLTAAQGGMFDDGRPNGGAGCARGMPATNGEGGAGGGGGCGYVLSNQALDNASVSPGRTSF